MFHVDGLVGVNTPALIEAGILGRMGHTILASEFATRQTDTLQFHYLLPDQGVVTNVRSARALLVGRHASGRWHQIPFTGH